MMIEVRIIQYGDTSHQPNMGVKEAEVLVGSMMNDGWEIKSYQYDSHIDDNHGGGVFVMVRDVEPVTEAVDSGFLHTMRVLFNLLSQNHIVGALRPGYLWQVQIATLKVAKWLQQHDTAGSNGSMFADNIREYITTHNVETDGEIDGMKEYAKRIHAEYLKQQEEDGEQ